MMNVLALDTASPLPAVAFVTPQGAWEERLSTDRRASEELLAAVQRVLDVGGIGLTGCERIVACSGPGSFTGTRVGLAAAWGLGRALGLPVEMVSTLEALAEAARPEDSGEIVAALDAGRGEVLLQPFSLREDRAIPLAPAERLCREDAARRFSTRSLVSLPGDLLRRPGRPLSNSLAHAAAVAAARAPRDTAVPTAFYMRASAAEEKLGAS